MKSKLYSIFVLYLFLVTPAYAENPLVSKVESYLNSLKSITADFSQSDAEGTVTGGRFLLKKPGKFRWEYDKRSPILIVSDGKQLVYQDKQLKEVTYANPEDTLANFLARNQVKLSGDVKLLSIAEDSTKISAQITQKDKPEQGSLVLHFLKNPMQIMGMEVIDQNGSKTQISFSGVVTDNNLDDRLFKFKNPKFNKNVWEN